MDRHVDTHEGTTISSPKLDTEYFDASGHSQAAKAFPATPGRKATGVGNLTSAQRVEKSTQLPWGIWSVADVVFAIRLKLMPHVPSMSLRVMYTTSGCGVAERSVSVSPSFLADTRAETGVSSAVNAKARLQAGTGRHESPRRSVQG